MFTDQRNRTGRVLKATGRDKAGYRLNPVLSCSVFNVIFCLVLFHKGSGWNGTRLGKSHGKRRISLKALILSVGSLIFKNFEIDTQIEHRCVHTGLHDLLCERGSDRGRGQQRFNV